MPVVELDGKPALATLVGDDSRCLTLTPPAALAEYLEPTASGASPSGWPRSGVIDVVATAAPGIDDIVVLGKIKQLEQQRRLRPDHRRRPGCRPRDHVPDGRPATC